MYFIPCGWGAFLFAENGFFANAQNDKVVVKPSCHCEAKPWQSVFGGNKLDNNYYVYILSNQTNVAIYVGVTNDLVRRVHEHITEVSHKSFAARYKIHKLVYYECTNDVYAALEREKQIKGWKRKKKNELIESMNPFWQDLYPSMLE